MKYYVFVEYYVWIVFDGGYMYLKRYIVVIKILYCDVKGFIEWMKKKLRMVYKGIIKKGYSGKIIFSI